MIKKLYFKKGDTKTSVSINTDFIDLFKSSLEQKNKRSFDDDEINDELRRVLNQTIDDNNVFIDSSVFRKNLTQEIKQNFYQSFNQ